MTRHDEVQGVPVEFSPVARGCLVALGGMLAAAVVAAAGVILWSGAGPPAPGPAPRVSTSPSWSHVPVRFPAEIELVLSAAWSAGRHGCGITGPAVDALTAALEQDVAEVPAPGAQIIAGRWVAERCRTGG